MEKQIDILAELEQVHTLQATEKHTRLLGWGRFRNSIKSEYHVRIRQLQKKIHTHVSDILKTPSCSRVRNVWKISKCIVQYLITTICIFFGLLVGTNYHAYSQLVMSYFTHEQRAQQNESMIQSVSAATNVAETGETEDTDISFDFLQNDTVQSGGDIAERHTPARLFAKAKNEDIVLDIDITPYENRIVIPKMGKNIPLVEVKNQQVQSLNKLHDIFMQELENGIVRYPGSALPGEVGNSFIFGHSSNFPWLPGDYNEVFTLLDTVVFGDEIIVYYDQKKYTYVVREKKVVRPRDTSVLQAQDKHKKTITLMTCWPLGTTTHRLLVIGELVETP